MSLTPDKPFADALASLTSKEMTQARGDRDREADAIERLAHALGFAIAMAAGGDPKAIDTMIEGATAYAHEEAVSAAPLAGLVIVTTNQCLIPR